MLVDGYEFAYCKDAEKYFENKPNKDLLYLYDEVNYTVDHDVVVKVRGKIL